MRILHISNFRCSLFAFDSASPSPLTSLAVHSVFLKTENANHSILFPSMAERERETDGKRKRDLQATTMSNHHPTLNLASSHILPEPL